MKIILPTVFKMFICDTCLNRLGKTSSSYEYVVIFYVNFLKASKEIPTENLSV